MHGDRHGHAPGAEIGGAGVAARPWAAQRSSSIHSLWVTRLQRVSPRTGAFVRLPGDRIARKLGGSALVVEGLGIHMACGARDSSRSFQPLALCHSSKTSQRSRGQDKVSGLKEEGWAVVSLHRASARSASSARSRALAACPRVPA